ncbi:Fat storage-inducing transmembrane protein [Halteromyces radiatus]|uniref:Fat storage-inducing transmembrane protein n=1 Tax=Halteromyces radiatus TaxID=101107 RepID=UPI002220E9A5|nr:Fat storage-inducing transmembrane protein [Halteromyces radiatus]KAI8093395.1 Fat storage-inducing transmembrane protein [Halteromyces radiatus]
MTQWCFGPSFIDRVYVATGGSCVPISQQSSILSGADNNDGDDLNLTIQQQQQHTLLLSQTFRQATCRQLGGQWSGGHDVSGHCVMLIHASLFLWEELSWVFYSIPAATQLKRSQPTAWRALLAVLTLLGLWWWMLVMTAIYFHGHYELVSGTFFGVFGWAILYLGLFPKLTTIGLPSQSL